MAAEFLTAIALAGSGDHIVSSAALYGGTHTLFDVTLGRLGIDVTFVPPSEVDAFAESIRPETKFLYTEIIANPSGAVADLAALAEVAHEHAVPLVVDATLATPYLCRPIEHGADIVVHSATKFLGGHGTSIGGVIVESGRFDWGNGKFPTMTAPVPSYGGIRFWENFAEYGFCTKVRAEQLRDVGASMSPFNAFLFLQGLETLPIRMEAHVAAAGAVARHLAAHPRSTGSRTPASRSTRTTSSPPGTSRSARARCSASVCTAGARRGVASSSRSSCSAISPTSATLAASSSIRRRPRTSSSPTKPRGGGRLPRSRAHLGRSRGCRRHPVRPRPGARTLAAMSGTETRGRWHPPTARERYEIIRSTSTVAVLGASANRARPSYFVSTYLVSSSTDFEVWFVNPSAEEILGRPRLPEPRCAPPPA